MNTAAGILFLSIFAHAQVNPSGTQARILRSEGQFFSVRIVMGEPTRIFIVGREEAQVDLAKMSLTLRRVKPYPGKILKIDRDNNYFTVSDPEDFKAAKELELVAKMPNQLKSETFHFDVKE